MYYVRDTVAQVWQKVDGNPFVRSFQNRTANGELVLPRYQCGRARGNDGYEGVLRVCRYVRYHHMPCGIEGEEATQIICDSAFMLGVVPTHLDYILWVTLKHVSILLSVAERRVREFHRLASHLGC